MRGSTQPGNSTATADTGKKPIARFRVCGDGGGNRLYDALDGEERGAYVYLFTQPIVAEDQARLALN